ncbi:MAG: 4-vinyl reductase [Candidatus Thermoplasmatota archaeon]
MKVVASEEDVTRILESYKVRTSVDFDKGQLRLNGLPILWSRAELQFNIFSELDNLIGEPADSVIRRIARPYGVSFCKLMQHGFVRKGSAPSRMEMLRDLCAENMAIGWGLIEIEDKNGDIEIRSKSGFPVSQEYHARQLTARRSVDAYFLGYMEGFFSTLDATTYTGEEVECLGKGDSQCRIVLRRAPGVR